MFLLMCCLSLLSFVCPDIRNKKIDYLQTQTFSHYWISSTSTTRYTYSRADIIMHDSYFMEQVICLRFHFSIVTVLRL